MLVGYNTNINYKGVTYHVQTEDSGPKNPVIVTLLYQKGAILASKKTGYGHLLGDPDLENKVQEMMKSQHKGMIKELVSGRYTGGGTAEAEASAEETGDVLPEEGKRKRSLDDVLADFIIGGKK